MQKSADEDEHLTPAMVQGNKLSVTAPPSDLLDQLSRSTAPTAQLQGTYSWLWSVLSLVLLRKCYVMLLC